MDTTVMSHAEVVSLLRRCSERVTLTLYRDGMATPGSPGSPVTARSTRLRYGQAGVVNRVIEYTGIESGVALYYTV